MRGRLIFQFLAEIFRLDTEGTANWEPPNTDIPPGGYDPDFKESVLFDSNDDGIGERIRVEHPAVRITCLQAT